MSDRVRLWWWGEDEAPGLASWVARAAMRHESEANVRVETRLLRHDRVIPSLPEAAKNGDTPDLHFLWNGIYHIEHAWDGLLEPLEQFFDTGQVAALTGGPQSRFRGQTFRAGWYLIPVVWVVNLELLAEAGVEAVPETWEQLVEACRRLKSANTPAIVGGDGEGDLSVWWLTHLLTQMLDRGTDVAQFALGDRSWREEPYSKAWSELHRFMREGWIDRASLPLTLWDAFVRFSEGVGAFTLASGPMFVRCRESLGDRVQMMVAPRLGQGGLAGRPIIDSQGLGIPAAAAAPGAGAALLEALLRPEAADTLYRQLGLVPAGSDWSADGDVDRDALWAHNHHLAGTSAPYVPNLLPLKLHFDVCAAVGQAVISGKFDHAAAGREADLRCRDWKRSDPQRLLLYREWIDDVRDAERGEAG